MLDEQYHKIRLIFIPQHLLHNEEAPFAHSGYISSQDRHPQGIDPSNKP